MLFLKSFNLSVFHTINEFAGYSSFLDRFAALMDYSGLKGLVLVGTFGALWFQPRKDQLRIRQSLIVMLVSVALAILIARTLAYIVPFETRPMYVLDIGYRAALLSSNDFEFAAWSSFPSDQAAMMFALAAGFWFASRLAGILVATFSLVALISRVYLGIHYPSDVFVGALIGIGTSALLNYRPIREGLASPVITLEKRLPGLFYSSLLIALFEAGTMFSTTRRVAAAVAHVVTGTYGNRLPWQ
jgi:membrane-associated phospholipid phosphatase